jgi:predicted transcriptional regulator of viral defense system
LNYDNIKKILIRLNAQGYILRITDGYYQKSNFSEHLNTQILVSINDVMSKTAKVNGWELSLTGTEALNKLGLSTQVPAHFWYLSSRPTRKFKIYNVEVRLKHISNRYTLNMSKISKMIVSAFEALGKNYTNSTRN